MQEVTLTIKGNQTNVEGDKNNIEIITEGKFYKKNDIYYIVYDESEITGMEGSTTTLKIERKKISMKRFGNNKSSLIFEKGIKHSSEYQTAYGNMPIDVVTTKADVEIDESGEGKINLAYRLDISGMVESSNKLFIDMKKA